MMSAILMSALMRAEAPWSAGQVKLLPAGAARILVISIYESNAAGLTTTPKSSDGVLPETSRTCFQRMQTNLRGYGMMTNSLIFSDLQEICGICGVSLISTRGRMCG
jgi:hypothetical protein